MTLESVDYLIIGAGIMGLCIARELIARKPFLKIAIIDKEEEVAFHASGRNSGVLHAGFYYSADSLKAKFTKEGNLAMREFCSHHGLKVNSCGKVVVASDSSEIAGLEELKRRGDLNKIDLQWVSRGDVDAIDPNVNFFGGRALYSPTTATVDPVLVCMKMVEELKNASVKIHLNTRFMGHKGHTVMTSKGLFDAAVLINAAGLYADKIAQNYGFGGDYTLLPFKGIYLKSSVPIKEFRTNIYPVPNLKNPFLGVHFTLTSDNRVKIGPTAIPAFWRENYSGWDRFNLKEALEVLRFESKLFLSNAFNFRSLAREEMKKYNRSYLLSLASKLVKTFNPQDFQHFSKAGIRAQLLHKKTLKLVQDFVVEQDANSIHILNAVSPAFTCSIPFAKWIVDHALRNTIHKPILELVCV